MYAIRSYYDRAETSADHYFSKADDGIERRAQLMADPRQHVGLGARGALGQAPGMLQFALALAALREIAEHGEEVRPVGAGPADGDRQRNEAALLHAAECLATVIEQAGDSYNFV